MYVCTWGNLTQVIVETYTETLLKSRFKSIILQSQMSRSRSKLQIKQFNYMMTGAL